MRKLHQEYVKPWELLKAFYPMFGDTSVSRRSVRFVADGVEAPERIGPPGLVPITYPMHLSHFNCIIPTCPLTWIIHAGLYERYSGDTELIRAMIPVMRRNLAVVDTWRNDEGLIETSAIPNVWMFFDYSDIRTDGASVALNAIYAKALDEAARLERSAGDTAQADAYAKQASRIRDALNRYCSDSILYPDVLLRNEEQALIPSRERCETTQYYAMWGSVPTPDRLWKSACKRDPP